MVLKGRSMIQLFDADTGVEVLRQTNNNIITNAIRNILNCPLDFNRIVGWKTIADVILPIQTKGLGGLLIWNNNIPEDPNIIFAPAGVHEVGHANSKGVYLGNNPYRGTINLAESGEIEGGYRHVWDFATDRANGEIKCLSLTSEYGGACGLHPDSGDHAFQLSIPIPIRSICEIEKDMYAAFDITDGSLKYYSVFNSDLIGLRTTTNDSPQLMSTKQITYNNYSSAGTRQYADGTILCLARITSTESKQLWVAQINTVTGEKIFENTITLANVVGYSGVHPSTPIVDAQNVYAWFLSENGEYHLLKFDYSGNYIQKVYGAGLYYAGAGVMNIGGKKYVTKNEVGFCGIDEHSDEMLQTNGSFMLNCSTGFSCRENLAPLLFCPSWVATETRIGLYSPYLGSINNLATPVIKTNKQTMKITYDIVEV